MLVGILAIQGDFFEHQTILEQHLKIPCILLSSLSQTINKHFDAIIIPGGESTTMRSLLFDEHGLGPWLREWVKGGGAVMGTCAGLICLVDCVESIVVVAEEDEVDDSQIGGDNGKDTSSVKAARENERRKEETIIGGLSCTVTRNWYGSQQSSFSSALHTHPHTLPKQSVKVPFIRSPLITSSGDCIVEATIQNATSGKETIVALSKGRLLGLAFHPELTGKSDWHRYFIDQFVCNESDIYNK